MTIQPRILFSFFIAATHSMHMVREGQHLSASTSPLGKFCPNEGVLISCFYFLHSGLVFASLSHWVFLWEHRTVWSPFLLLTNLLLSVWYLLTVFGCLFGKAASPEHKLKGNAIALSYTLHRLSALCLCLLSLCAYHCLRRSLCVCSLAVPTLCVHVSVPVLRT